MLVKMKKAFKDLATAHFTNKYAKSEKYANSHFFSRNLCFCIKAHFHNKSGNNVRHFIDFPFW